MCYKAPDTILCIFTYMENKKKSVALNTGDVTLATIKKRAYTKKSNGDAKITTNNTPPKRKRGIKKITSGVRIVINNPKPSEVTEKLLPYELMEFVNNFGILQNDYVKRQVAVMIESLVAFQEAESIKASAKIPSISCR